MTRSPADWFARVKDLDGVVFDFGGVMTVSPRNDGWSVYRYCEERGVSRAIVDRMWAECRHLWDGDFISFDDYYRRTFAAAGRTVSASELADLWELDAASWVRERRSDTLELMRLVKTAGKKIGILSNMSSDFYERLFVPRMAAYRAFADVEVISGLVKLFKPERAIYDLTAARLGLAPERLMFLDDTPANVEAARRHGWHSEVYS
ncbi:MAG: HAD-IA family hydrolase [Kiritimatiellia bacterium]